MAGMFEQPRNAGTLFLGGTKISGADIRDQNGSSDPVYWLETLLIEVSARYASYRKCSQELLRSFGARQDDG